MSGLKSICLFCLAFLCIACATTPSKKVKTYEDIYGNRYEYEFLSSGEVRHTITGTKFPIPEGIQIRRFTGTTNEIEIPQQIEKRQVVRISPSAFSKKQLINVIIPDTVAVIFASAFSNNKLTNVTIPGSVYGIGDYAFAYNQLTNVSFNNGTAIIAQEAFANNKLSNVTIPDSIKRIDKGAFKNNLITDVSIGNSVVTIGDEAFRNNKLTRVTIPESVNEIGDYAFADNSLTSVTIPGSVRTIGMWAFADNSLTSVTIQEGVTTIGDRAFSDNSLTSVTIPASVRTIGAGAFTRNKLTSVNIPAGVTTIGSNAFYGSIQGLLEVYGRRAGTYEKRNDQWYYNGTALIEPARLVCQSDFIKGFIYITKIDGKAASSNGVTRISNFFSLPAGSTEDNVYLAPGFHSIEVGWFKHDSSSTAYSQGTVTFEHRLMLESAVYDLTGEYYLTGEGQGIQILFRITKR